MTSRSRTICRSYAIRAYKDVTIKQVLQMSSGIQFNEDYADESSDLNRLAYEMAANNQSISEYVTTLPRSSEPGTFVYKSIDTHILVMLIEEATSLPSMGEGIGHAGPERA
ncbi:serine hydrolase [Paenibacillus uliginis]|uniref:serine hydrolase n=1 Tax=Paenibacillus uliginis TaxID=683737 RepID=UPI001AD8311D|nr:serine hydrolase [Paenibacillus uliginis]